jgi:uncharacterized membrane protein YozB (DUF420 family)
MNLRTENGFLGANASLLADLTLLSYVLLLVPLMLLGLFYARKKRFEPNHKYVMTTITILNWLIIAFIMAVSYSDSVAPNVSDNLSERVYLLPTIHLITGGLAQLMATYLVIRMWFEKSLPDWFKIKNIKLAMRTTLLLWLTTAVLGILIYLTWYNDDKSPINDKNVPAPVTTEEAGSLLPVTTEEP